MTPLGALTLATVALVAVLTVLVVGLLWAVVYLLASYRPRR